MRRSEKIWLIAAAILVAAGLILFAAVMTVCRWDFTRLSTVEYETRTHEITEKFHSISVQTSTADIRLLPSDDEICRVVCRDAENAGHAVAVRDGTITIERQDERSVKNFIEYIGVNIGSPEITLYLPHAEYTALHISLSTGDVLAQNIFADEMEISSTTGRITLTDINCTGDIRLDTTTGKITLTRAACKNLTANGTTGSLSMTSVTAAERFTITRNTGDVTFDACDAAEISVTTTTGDVTGTFLTGKTFRLKTSTGNIDFPKISSGGICEVKTTTGDIKLNTP